MGARGAQVLTIERGKKTFVITRFDPDRDDVPRTQAYEVPAQSDWKVLDALAALGSLLAICAVVRL